MDKEIFTIATFVNGKILHCAPIASGSDVYRVIIQLLATQPQSEAGKLFKEYEVWVTSEIIEDTLHLKNSPTLEEIKSFVEDFLRKRIESEKTLPVENGAYLSNKGTTFGNPRTFPLSLEDKPKLVKTTIMLPDSTHKWLRDYGHQKNIGLGEAIRRVVSDFQAGTVTTENAQQKIVDNSGVPSKNQNNE